MSQSFSTWKKEGTSYHLVPTDKFKTTTILVTFSAPLEAKTLTSRAILPYIMEKSTAAYPSMKALREPLETLYDAGLYADASKFGEEHVISFQLDVVRGELVHHPSLLKEALELLEQMVLYPDLTEGGFREQFVKQEKRLHALRISSLYDDKMRYAQQRLLELMAPGEAVALPSLGTLEELEQITPSSLRDTYRSMIEDDRIDVFVVGYVTKEEMEDALSFLPSHSEKISHYIPAQKAVNGVKRSSETQPIKQGKLHLGYRVAVDPTSADSIRMQIVNGLFGGFPHSKLFMNVREKESLAYYAASRYAALNSALYVYAGVDTKEAERAEKIILEQLVDLKAGQFTDEELTQTKAMLINARRQILDQPGQLIGWLNGSKMRGLTLEDEIHIIETATREDVVRLAAAIDLDAVYLLRGEA